MFGDKVSHTVEVYDTFFSPMSFLRVGKKRIKA
jgi:hypothetical protein